MSTSPVRPRRPSPLLRTLEASVSRPSVELADDLLSTVRGLRSLALALIDWAHADGDHPTPATRRAISAAEELEVAADAYDRLDADVSVNVRPVVRAAIKLVPVLAEVSLVQEILE